jgi:hypothetical protein
MQAVTDDLCPQLLKLLRLSSDHRTLLLIPDLPRADKIFAGDDIQTQSVINADTIGSLHRLMENNLQLLLVIDADINLLFRLMNDKKLLLVIDADIIGSLVRLIKENNLQSLVLPLLNEILISSSEEDVLRVACWALSYISDDREDFQAILDSGVCHNNLGKLLRCPSNSVLYLALRTVINIFTGCYRHVQSANNTIDADRVMSLVRLMKNRHLLEERVLPFLKEKLISSTDEDVLRVACWALSCICEDRSYHEAIVDDVGHQLVELLRRSSNSVLYPVIRTVRNIFSGCDYEIQVF